MNPLVQKAIGFAWAAHAGQKYETANGPVGYEFHLRGVAAPFATAENSDPVLVAAAWLHDTVEDNANITVDLLNKLFGREVAEIVDALTRRPGEIYLARYIPRVAANEKARRIKLSDLAFNIDQCLANPTAQNEGRLVRYKKALAFLENKVDNWRLLA